MEAKTLAWQAKNNQPVQTSHRFVAESVLRFLGIVGYDDQVLSIL